MAGSTDNWFTRLFSSSPTAGSGAADQFSGYAPQMTAGQTGVGGFTAPTSQDPNTALNQYGVQSNWGNEGFNTGGSGGMNWAGLASGLSNLSKQMGGSGQQQATPMSNSPSVSNTVSGGVLQPKDAGGGASALASVLDARNQLAQYLMLAAMQGKGRGRSGQGLLG
jgi:hypothetical protein